MAPPTILIVEDNPEFRELLSIILSQAGYRALTAENGGEGLELLRRERPDMVVTDIQMPVMDGYELCRAIRSDPVSGRVPVILISVLSKVDEIVAGLKLGADDYINKPFDPDEVLARIRALFRKAGG